MIPFQVFWRVSIRLLPLPLLFHVRRPTGFYRIHMSFYHKGADAKNSDTAKQGPSSNQPGTGPQKGSNDDIKT